MTVIGYVRVSTDAQADKGFGLDVQGKALREWCARNGHRLVSVCEDASVSGMADALDRPDLTDAIAAVAGRRAQGVVLARMDRLARPLDVREGALAMIWCHDGHAFGADIDAETDATTQYARSSGRSSTLRRDGPGHSTRQATGSPPSRSRSPHRRTRPAGMQHPRDRSVAHHTGPPHEPRRAVVVRRGLPAPDVEGLPELRRHPDRRGVVMARIAVRQRANATKSYAVTRRDPDGAFREVAEEWLLTRTRAKPHTIAEYRRLLDKRVLPEFGGRKIGTLRKGTAPATSRSLQTRG